MALHELLGGLYCLLHAERVERETVECGLALTRRVDNRSLLGIEALLAHVGTLDKRYDGKVEMLGKSIVARVVGRHGHDCSGAVAGQHIFAYPHWYLVAGEGVDGIRARENARHAVVGDAFALGALLHVGHIFVYGSLLVGGGELLYELALGCQHHERHTEDGVGAGGEHRKTYP